MSKEEREEGKSFKVVDRRRFDSAGDERDDVPDRVEEPAAAPSDEAQAPKASEDPPPAGERPPMDFMTFVASLATNALAALGALPKEQTQGMPVNPTLGKEYIDILGMLQEKTQGNLSAQEAEAMQRIVTDLRMAYVEVSRKGGAEN